MSPGCSPRSTGLPNPLPGPQSCVPVENRGPPPVLGMQEKAPICGFPMFPTVEYIPVGTVYEVRQSWVPMAGNYPGYVGCLLLQPEHLGFQGPDDGQATSSCQEPRPKIAPKPQKAQKPKEKQKVQEAQAPEAQNQKTSGAAPTSKEIEDGGCEGADEPKNSEKRTQPNAKNLQQMTLGLAYVSFRVGDLEPETRLALEKVRLLAEVQSFQNDSELTWSCHSPVKSHSYHNPSVDSSDLLGFIALKSSTDSGPLKISGRIWLCPEAEAYDHRRLVRWMLAQVALQFFSHKVFSRDHDVVRNHLTLPWMNENTQIEAGARNRTCSFQMSLVPKGALWLWYFEILGSGKPQ